MERKFYTNDFEHLLKENADQFKMFPSKKVWHGIYNDIQPGRRWPSIAMSLLFVFTLVLIGHLNTQQTPQGSPPDLIKKTVLQKSSDKNETPGTSSNLAKGILQTTALNVTSKPLLKASTKEQLKDGAITSVSKNSMESSNIVSSDIMYPSVEKNSESNILPFSNTDNKNISVTNKITDLQNLNASNIELSDRIAVDDGAALNTDYITTPIPFATVNINNESFSKSLEGINTVPNIIENKVESDLTLKKISKNSRISWTYYLAPSVSYRKYSKQANNTDQAYLGYLNNSNYTGSNRAVTHNPSAGLEVGTAMKYSLTKKLKLTAGLQANYSSYRIKANDIHPIIATLILHSEAGMPYAISTISYFGNGPGAVPVNLNSYSLQLSVPVGLEYQLAGSDRVQFSVAGSLQPSLVLDNRGYMLSTDKRNYLTQSSLTRHWNMAASAGTYISFTSNKFKWQVGPQVQYQLLSAYSNNYPVKEHFINYGIRVGVSKLLR